MRGKAFSQQKAETAQGITPAYAGKRQKRFRQYWFGQDHPRVCGEKLTFGQTATEEAGSPPRVRGKERDCGEGAFVQGITPAYAGKSCVVSGRTSQSWDHPRVCGEKVLL